MSFESKNQEMLASVNILNDYVDFQTNVARNQLIPKRPAKYAGRFSILP